MQHGSDDLKRGSVAMKRSVFKQGCAPALPSASAIFTYSRLRSPTDLFAFERGGRKQNERKRKSPDKTWESFFDPLEMRNTHKHAGRAGVRGQMALNSLSPFRLRTSEVPLCAALHLFYPSSLIRARG